MDAVNGREFPSKKKAALRPPVYINRSTNTESGELGLEKLPVHAGDELDVDPLGTGCHTLVVIGAVAETAFCHGFSHVLHAHSCFGLALGQQRQLGDLGAGEEHGGTVRATGHTSTAPDALGSIRGLFSYRLGNQDGIAVRHATRMTGCIAASLDDSVECSAIDDQVLDDREGTGAPRFNIDGIAILEFTHMQLADRCTILAAMRCPVNNL